MEKITIAVFTLIASILTILIGFIFRSLHGRVSDMEKKSSAIGNKLDSKIDKDMCEGHRKHQTDLNVDMIDRLARIETKMDILIQNGRNK